MLIVAQFDVRLIRVQREHLATILNWRNSAHVRQNMFYQDLLNENDQLTWFESINNANNYYFIIEYLGVNVGLIHAKNVTEKEQFGEGGIFIGEFAYLDSWASVMASLCLLNFIFMKLTFTKSVVNVRTENKAAVSYNKQLGYIIDFQDEKVIKMSLSKENFLEKTARLNKTLGKMSQVNAPLSLVGKKAANNLAEINGCVER